MHWFVFSARIRGHFFANNSLYFFVYHVSNSIMIVLCAVFVNRTLNRLMITPSSHRSNPTKNSKCFLISSVLEKNHAGSMCRHSIGWASTGRCASTTIIIMISVDVTNTWSNDGNSFHFHLAVNQLKASFTCYSSTVRPGATTTLPSTRGFDYELCLQTTRNQNDFALLCGWHWIERRIAPPSRFRASYESIRMRINFSCLNYVFSR